MVKGILHNTLLSLITLMWVLAANASVTLNYEYDANGNLIRGDGKFYEYNDANQLVRVRHRDENGPVIAEYFYDHNGQRIKKIEDGVTTYYIGKHFEVQIEETQPRNTSYYFANGKRIAKKDSVGNVSYYHADHLGGTNAVTRVDGNLMETTKYYPFGETREGGKDTYGFTGKEKDKILESYYFESRYYDPQLKHFMQADNITVDIYNPQNLNKYSYVVNNPLTYSDPSGHLWWNPSDWFRGFKNWLTREKTAQDTVTDRSSGFRLENVALRDSQSYSPNDQVKSSSKDDAPDSTEKILAAISSKNWEAETFIDENGKQIKYGFNCKRYVNAVIQEATGKKLPSIYNENYKDIYNWYATGAVINNETGEILVRPGDILQSNKPHTAIVKSLNISEGTVTVNEANWVSGKIADRTEPVRNFKDYGVYRIPD